MFTAAGLVTGTQAAVSEAQASVTCTPTVRNPIRPPISTSAVCVWRKEMLSGYRLRARGTWVLAAADIVAACVKADMFGMTPCAASQQPLLDALMPNAMSKLASVIGQIQSV